MRRSVYFTRRLVCVIRRLVYKIWSSLKLDVYPELSNVDLVYWLWLLQILKTRERAFLLQSLSRMTIDLVARNYI